MTRKITTSALTLMLLLPHLQAAEVIPGRWEKVDLLLSGSPIIVKTRYSEVIHCTYYDSNRDSLLIVESNGTQRRIRKDEVESIIAEQYEDSLKNGMLIGMVGGVGAALLLAFASDKPLHRSRANTAVFGSIMFGLMGMGAGALIDYEHKGREVIYQAPKADK